MRVTERRKRRTRNEEKKGGKLIDIFLNNETLLLQKHFPIYLQYSFDPH